MRTIIKYSFLFILMAITARLSSQNGDFTFSSVPLGDTVVPQRVVILDSTYLNKDIIELINEYNYYGSQIEVNQRVTTRELLNNYIATASKRAIPGFRVRIFFNNDQHARVRSDELVESFSQAYPTIGVYRTYDNPYFKVTVGDLRTKSDAVKMLKKIEQDYPSAFIVREDINFPPL